SSQAGVHRDQVIQARGGKEFIVDTEGGGDLGVGEDEVKAFDRGGIDVGVPGNFGKNIGLAAGPNNGDQVLLTIEFQTVVDAAVQVDGQLRDARHRGGVDQVLGVVGDEATGKAQSAIQPRVHQGATVDLYSHSAVTGRGVIGQRFDPKSRGISVGSHDAEGGTLWQVGGDFPDEYRTVPHHHVATGLTGARARGVFNNGESG